MAASPWYGLWNNKREKWGKMEWRNYEKEKEGKLAGRKVGNDLNVCKGEEKKV